MTKRILPKILGIFAIAMILSSCAGTKTETEQVIETETLVTIETTMGDIKLILFDDTPIHKTDFLNLAMAGKYDGSIFHRVINNFMIQGGSLKAEYKAFYDTLSFEDKTLPAEFNSNYKHIKGALAAARTNNPEKRSDITEFYIVQNNNGAHHLNGAYTIFGQTLVGLDVVDKIAATKTMGSKPVVDISMKIRVDIVPKSDIIKFYGDVYKKYNIGKAVK